MNAQNLKFAQYLRQVSGQIKAPFRKQTQNLYTMYKHILLGISFSLFASDSFAQLQVITAIGGDGKNVNWAAIKAEQDADTEGPGYFYHDCAQGVRATKASSTLTAQGAKSYAISNLTDDDPMTAWVEGVAGYGIGQWFEIECALVTTIYNGYQSSPTNWLNNSRVKRFKVYVDGKEHCYLDLTDEMGDQNFDLGLEWKSGESPTPYKIGFEIVDVYKGAKWDDVCISHVDHMACCFAVTTQLSVLTGTVEAGTIQKGSSILAFDAATNTVHETEVVLNASQEHVTLLHVTAGGKSIDITPEHPLNVEGRGFISLAQLKSEAPNKSYAQLIGTCKVQLWNETSSTSYYAAVDSIEEMHGAFQTVTVRKLSSGTMYIANGFISETY